MKTQPGIRIIRFMGKTPRKIRARTKRMRKKHFYQTPQGKERLRALLDAIETSMFEATGLKQK